MTTAPGNNNDSILSTVQKHVPSSFWKVQNITSDTEIGITIPVGYNSVFPAMFLDLTTNKEKLGILAMGLSLTTMDEVYIKVGELTESENQITGSKVTTKKSQHIPGQAEVHLVKLLGPALSAQQFSGLLIKRFECMLKKVQLLAGQFVVPILLVTAAILISNPTVPVAPPALKMALNDYPGSIVLYNNTNTTQNLGDSYAEYTKSSATVRLVDNVVDELLEAGREDVAVYRASYIVAAEFGNTIWRAMFSTIPEHSSPLAINLVSNAILNSRRPTEKYSIEVTNHPLHNELSSLMRNDDGNIGSYAQAWVIFNFFVPLGMAIFAATFSVGPIEERLCKSKQLQLMTGVSPLIYWGSSFLFDFIIMMLLSLVIVCCFPIFQSNEAFTAGGGYGPLFLILVVYGFTAIAFSYFCSLFAKTIPSGFAFITITSLVIVIFCPFTVFILEEWGHGDQAILPLLRLGSFFPAYGLAISLLRYLAVAIFNTRCAIPENYQKLICVPGNAIGTGPIQMLQHCCENCNQIGDGTCFKRRPYLGWHHKPVLAAFGPVTDDVAGIPQFLLHLGLIGIFYICLVLLVDYGVISKILQKFKTGKAAFNQPQDAEAQAEAERVKSLVQTGRINEDALLVSSLCKNYGAFAAVSNLSFGVHHGECFGMLGVNGAGKSTTFRMLTGDEVRTSGNAFTNNYTLEKNPKKFFTSIGYCPQYDGNIEILTGRQMLQLFCRLKGIPGKSVASEATKWLNKMGLESSAHVPCGRYSGGMKRRLSAGIAMVGDPEVVLLDEPTSGVDPVARRQFWDVVSDVTKAGQAVILTSHSMDECEALCSRLGIMVNGQFQCFGGVQQLKNKFAQGFSLSMKLNSVAPSPQLTYLQNDILAKFYPCTLKDEHQNFLNYQILNAAIPWNVIFQTLEELKNQYKPLIEDYSVNETTLEEIFLTFARQQYAPRKAKLSRCVKCMTCQCCC